MCLKLLRPQDCQKLGILAAPVLLCRRVARGSDTARRLYYRPRQQRNGWQQAGSLSRDRCRLGLGNNEIGVLRKQETIGDQFVRGGADLLDIGFVARIALLERRPRVTCGDARPNWKKYDPRSMHDRDLHLPG